MSGISKALLRVVVVVLGILLFVAGLTLLRRNEAKTQATLVPQSGLVPVIGLQNASGVLAEYQWNDATWRTTKTPQTVTYSQVLEGKVGAALTFTTTGALPRSVVITTLDAAGLPTEALAVSTPTPPLQFTPKQAGAVLLEVTAYWSRAQYVRYWFSLNIHP